MGRGKEAEMVTREENGLMTRVEGDAPMGKLIRGTAGFLTPSQTTWWQERRRALFDFWARTSSPGEHPMAALAFLPKRAPIVRRRCSWRAWKAMGFVAFITDGRPTCRAPWSRHRHR